MSEKRKQIDKELQESNQIILDEEGLSIPLRDVLSDLWLTQDMLSRELATIKNQIRDIHKALKDPNAHTMQ